MTATESDQLIDKITAGVKLAIQRLIERTKKEDGEFRAWWLNGGHARRCHVE